MQVPACYTIGPFIYQRVQKWLIFSPHKFIVWTEWNFCVVSRSYQTEYKEFWFYVNSWQWPITVNGGYFNFSLNCLRISLHYIFLICERFLWFEKEAKDANREAYNSHHEPSEAEIGYKYFISTNNEKLILISIPCVSTRA